MKPKVLMVTNMLSPYRIPLFNRVSEMQEFDFRVVALCTKGNHRDWTVPDAQVKFTYRILPGRQLYFQSKDLSVYLHKGLWGELTRYNPDIIITSGYSTFAYWEAFLYSKIRRKKFILSNETTFLSELTNNIFTRCFKKFIIKYANSYISYGTKATEFIEDLGAARHKIHKGLNTVDMDLYREKCFSFRRTAKFESIRQKYPPVMLLYAGQLIERKGVEHLLRAYKNLHDLNVGLFIVGNGLMETELKEYCRVNKLQNVYFEGFKQQDELVHYYALADVFVLPSVSEVWGLVVNEALASGLYVLCSECAGAAYDLIDEEWSGEVFSPGSPEQLAGMIKEAKKNINDISSRRELISEHACREFGLDHSARAFWKAVLASKL